MLQKTTLVLALLLLIGFTSCDNYGKKTTKGHVETYYKEGITEDQAKKVSVLLYNMDEGTGPKSEKSFQLCKEHDTVCFRMVVNAEKAKALGDFSFLAIANIVSDSAFNGAPVNMDLTDNKFESVKKITYKKIDLTSPEKL
jgi:hypothetical protein